MEKGGEVIVPVAELHLKLLKDGFAELEANGLCLEARCETAIPNAELFAVFNDTVVDLEVLGVEETWLE